MNISVVIPVHNESGNISSLEKEIRTCFGAIGIAWECIWVDDASTDNTWQEIHNLLKPNRGIKLQKNCGQTIATMVGIESSHYEYIVTLDGDCQNDPSDVIEMVNLIKRNPEKNLIQGYRSERKDSYFSRKVVSKIANTLIRKISGHRVIDLGCSIRLFKKDLITGLILTGEMHRLFTLYLLDNGAKIIQLSVNHRPRNKGQSKYGLGRIFKLFMDILLYKTSKKIFINPLYTFAKLSLFGFIFSFLLFITAIVLRVLNIKQYLDGSLISTSLIIFSTSSIFIGLGLIGEIQVRNVSQSRTSNQYTISSTYN